MDKVSWTGTVVSVQPRIRLTRSFDERWHTYLGYMLILDGEVDGGEGRFSVAIGKAAQQKHQFRVGQSVSGNAVPVADDRLEPVDFYRASKLKVLTAAQTEDDAPPWHTPAPELDVYRERGHRRLSVRTYDTACLSCVWGCRMAVEMIIDQWNPGQKRYRAETFCYGPKSCSIYKAGPTRKVPGRKGMSWEEEDWVDEDATAHRGPDE
jgi:hypothetical protein